MTPDRGLNPWPGRQATQLPETVFQGRWTDPESRDAGPEYFL